MSSDFHKLSKISVYLKVIGVCIKNCFKLTPLNQLDKAVSEERWDLDKKTQLWTKTLYHKNPKRQAILKK